MCLCVYLTGLGEWADGEGDVGASMSELASYSEESKMHQMAGLYTHAGASWDGCMHGLAWMASHMAAAE